MAIVTLLTDFGTYDHYVGVMKGVILQVAPKATLVDISHQIPRHDITRAAFMLRQTLPWFPAETVHLAVVDPGVGSDRRIVVARYANQFIVAPDNGLLSFVHAHFPAQEIRYLDNTQFILREISSTFHGRDVMGPAAGHLAAGAKLRDFGPLADRIEVLPLARPELLSDHRIRGQIIHIDVFGNLVTNIPQTDALNTIRRRPNAAVTAGSHNLGAIRETYSEVSPGAPLALIGSSALLEIAVNGGNAAHQLALDIGAQVTVE